MSFSACWATVIGTLTPTKNELTPITPTAAHHLDRSSSLIGYAQPTQSMKPSIGP